MKLLIAFLAFISVTVAFHAYVKFDNTESYCIILDADAKGYITYDDLHEGPKKYEFDINPIISHGDGQCSGIANKTTTETINIRFYPSNYTPTLVAADPWTLSINFGESQAQTNNAYKLVSYNLTAILYDDLFPNATQHTIIYVQDPTSEYEWHGEQTTGFSCSESGLAFVNNTSVTFSNLKLVAFGLLGTDKFPSSQSFDQCKLDARTSDVVPIVVGACLAGLVIVVLIAYLIGRARAKRQGYASV
jgi:hypothetical protein